MIQIWKKDLFDDRIMNKLSGVIDNSKYVWFIFELKYVINDNIIKCLT